jgi:hypothetical protein
MHQQHYGHRSELLGKGREAEICLWADFGSRPQIGNAVAALENCATVVDHENGGAWRV